MSQFATVGKFAIQCSRYLSPTNIRYTGVSVALYMFDLEILPHLRILPPCFQALCSRAIPNPQSPVSSFSAPSCKEPCEGPRQQNWTLFPAVYFAHLITTQLSWIFSRWIACPVFSISHNGVALKPSTWGRSSECSWDKIIYDEISLRNLLASILVLNCDDITYNSIVIISTCMLLFAFRLKNDFFVMMTTGQANQHTFQEVGESWRNLTRWSPTLTYVGLDVGICSEARWKTQKHKDTKNWKMQMLITCMLARWYLLG